MLTVRDPFPSFALTAAQRNNDGAIEFVEVSSLQCAGLWTVLVCWPKDFTFVCPTEISGYADHHQAFTDAGVSLLGLSLDSEYVHQAWLEVNPLLANVRFPLLSDLKRELTTALGVLHRDSGVPLRATFVVDPEGTIRHVSVNDLDVGRDPAETLRIVLALQSGGLTACGWTPGDPNLVAA